MKKKQYLGNALLLLTGMIWGSGFVGQRLGMETEVGPITFNAARMLLAGLFISLVIVVMDMAGRRMKTGSQRRIETAANAVRDDQKYTVIGGVCCGAVLAAGATFQQAGIVYTEAGKAGFITAMYILLVPIINFLFFRKKNTWIVWFAVVVGVAGMYLLCVHEGFSFSKGDLLLLACALFFSFHILCCDYFVKRADPLWLSTIQFLTTAILSAVVALFTETPTWEKIVSAMIPILYCGIVSGGIGYTLQIVAQKFTDPTIASLLMSLESVFAALAGTILLHESMSLQEGIGCIILFAAIIWAQIPLPKKHRP